MPTNPSKSSTGLNCPRRNLLSLFYPCYNAKSRIMTLSMPLARSVSSATKNSSAESILQVSNYDSDEAFQLLISKCNSFIVNVAHAALDAKPPSSSSKSFSQMTTSYYKVQHTFFLALVEKYDKTKDLSLPIELAKDEWETEYMSAPKQITLN